MTHSWEMNDVFIVSLIAIIRILDLNYSSQARLRYDSLLEQWTICIISLVAIARILRLNSSNVHRLLNCKNTKFKLNHYIYIYEFLKIQIN